MGSIPSTCHHIKEKTDTEDVLWEKILSGAYRGSGILPCEEMMRAISTTSVIRINNIPSGKQVRECGARKKNVAQISRSVQISRVYLRATAIPRALRGEVCEPLARHKFFLELQTIYPRKWVRFCAEHKKRDRHPLWSAYSSVFGAYRECGILAGEQLVLAISTISVI